jgi:hypothetical protein
MLRTAAAFLLLGAAVAARAAPPARVTLVYGLQRDGQPLAEVTETLEHRDGRYEIASEAKGRGILAALPLGQFRRDSRGEVTPAGLRPEAFRDQRGGRTAEATFDWTARTLATSYRDRVETHALDGATHDRLTQVYTFAFARPLDAPFEMRVTDGRGVADHRYAVTGREWIDVPAGRFETLRIERVRDPGDLRETAVWLAIRRHHLPVRVLVVERDGARLDQVLERMTD